MINIKVNGQSLDLDKEQSIEDLINILSLQDQPIAIAINRKIIPSSNWNFKFVKFGDSVDIVRAIGGG